MNERQNKRKQKKLNEIKSRFFENTNKFCKPLAKLIKRERTQINKGTDEKETSQQTLRKLKDL